MIHMPARGKTQKYQAQAAECFCLMVLPEDGGEWFVNDENKPGCESKDAPEGKPQLGTGCFVPEMGKKGFSCPSVVPKAASGHFGPWFGFQHLPQQAQRDFGQRTMIKVQKMKEIWFAFAAGGQGRVFILSSHWTHPGSKAPSSAIK